MMVSSHILARLVQNHPERMGLALLSLAAGKESCPELDVSRYLEQIVALAEDISLQLPQSPATGDILFAMNTRLFDEMGFHVELEREEDESPFLHRLLDERHSRTVTLVVLYLTIGRLLNLPLEGVSFVGRLLVRVADNSGGDVIDPGAGGVVLTNNELQHILTTKLGNEVGPPPHYHSLLQRLDDRALMVRLLRRHKELYLAGGHHEAALLMVGMILDLMPESGTELLDRAQLMERLQQPEAAAADYLRYLECYPDSCWRDDLFQRTQLLLSTPAIVH